MADDPRLERMLGKAIGPGVLTEQSIPGGSVHVSRAVAMQLLAAADAGDPLRALLADEDRALELIMNGISTWTSRYQARRDALSVLAALRGVADHA